MMKESRCMQRTCRVFLQEGDVDERGICKHCGGFTRATIVHVGGTRKIYDAMIAGSSVVIYPPLDVPSAFRLKDGKSRKKDLRDWSLDALTLRTAREITGWVSSSERKALTKRRANYVT